MNEGAANLPTGGCRVVIRPDWNAVLAPAFAQPIPVDAVARMAALWRTSGTFTDPRLARVEEVLDDRFRADATKYSGVFEPSFSFDGKEWHCVRFSYAFPDFRDGPGPVCETILEAARPFGAPLTTHVTRLLRWAFHPFIEQPIIGLSFDGPESWVFKVYFQVDPRLQDQAIRHLARLVPWGSLQYMAGGAVIHLVGVDIVPQGIRSVKLYFLHWDVATIGVAGVLLPSRLIEYLAGQGVTSFSNLITVHRFRWPDDAWITQTSGVDFPLVENGLREIEVFGESGMLAQVFPALPSPPVCSGGFSRFLRPSVLDGTLLRVVRMTLSATPDPKVNLYFHVVAADD